MAQNEHYKVTIVFTDQRGGRTWTSGFYVKQTTVTGFDVSDVGAKVKDWWNTAYTGGVAMKQLYDVDIKLDSVKLRKISPLEPVETSYTTGLPIAGTDVTDPLTSEAALLLSLRTAKIGRSYRGRMYLPSISEDQVDESLTPTAATTIGTQFKGLVNALTAIGIGSGATAQVEVWSKKLAIGTPVTAVKVDQWMRSQRRRNVKAGAYSTVTV